MTNTYDLENWQKRFAERADLCTFLTHLTKDGFVNGKAASAMDVLIEILRAKKLVGGTGYVVGTTTAVCFQESPPLALAQNLYFEDKAGVPVSQKARYTGLGVMFSKILVYQAGGRPVVYEETGKAKNMLPSDEHWRIVKLDYSNLSEIVDWTHEREWRVPREYEFDLKDVTVVLLRDAYREFVERVQALEPNFLSEIAGIVTLNPILV